MKISHRTLKLFDEIVKVLAPPPVLSVSKWADTYRRLSAEASVEPGQWNTDRAPYQRRIMDCLNENEVQEIVVMSSSQVGKSEILLNILGYYIDYDPSPIMLMQPTVNLAEGFSKDRFAPMVRDTPALRGKIADPKSRDGENTILHKKFPGGHVTIVGANAPTDLSSRPIKVLLCDEVDRYPISAGKEGDPLGLATKRTTTFWNRRIVKVSTPTVQGISRIEQEYGKSSMEQWCVPCPVCGKYQPYQWPRIHFEDATMECMYCGERFTEFEWKENTEHTGKWIAQKDNPKVKGFHLNELASPWKHWNEIIKDFKEANKVKKETGSIEQLKVFINTSLGESWYEKGEGAEEETLLNRRESYHADLPDGVVLLTAGVDVQDDRLEIEVVGWRKGFESWGIQYQKIFGDLEKEETWDKLTYFLDKEFKFKNGNGLLIAATCLDTGGHFTSMAYKYLKKMERLGKRIYGIKGQGGPGIPLINKKTNNTQNGVSIFMLGVDQGKEMILSRLKTIDEGPGYCHFPINKERQYNETYMKGLVSEQKVMKFDKHGKPKFEWIKKSGVRNEPLDLRNYATAAVELLMPNWDVLEDKINRGINYMIKKKKKTSRKTGCVGRGVEI